MTDSKEYSVIRGTVDGQEKYCRIPIRRKTGNAVATQMLREEIKILKGALKNGNEEIELPETDCEQRIEVLEKAIDALNKQIAIEPVKDEYEHDCCPTCGYCGIYKDEWGGRYIPHCENCGQAIDWDEDGWR